MQSIILSLRSPGGEKEYASVVGRTVRWMADDGPPFFPSPLCSFLLFHIRRRHLRCTILTSLSRAANT